MRLLYCDNDAIIFTKKPGAELNLDLGYRYGAFRPQIQNPKSFIALGRKCYNVLHMNQNGEMENKTVIAGMYQSKVSPTGKLEHDTFVRCLEKIICDTPEPINVTQIRKRVNEDQTVTYVKRYHRFGTKIHLYRVLTPNLSTVPYGFM